MSRLILRRRPPGIRGMSQRSEPRSSSCVWRARRFILRLNSENWSTVPSGFIWTTWSVLEWPAWRRGTGGVRGGGRGHKCRARRTQRPHRRWWRGPRERRTASRGGGCSVGAPARRGRLLVGSPSAASPQIRPRRGGDTSHHRGPTARSSGRPDSRAPTLPGRRRTPRQHARGVALCRPETTGAAAKEIGP